MNVIEILIFTLLYIILCKNIKNADKEDSFSKKEFFLISSLAIYQPFNFYANNVFEIKFLVGILIISVVYLYFLIIFFLANKYINNKNKSLLLAIIFIFLSLNFFKIMNIINYISIFCLYIVSVVNIQKFKKSVMTFALTLLILNTLLLANNYTKIIKNKIVAKSVSNNYYSKNFSKKSDKKRDIYIILLDQYSGTDMLKKKWNFDNSEFINALEKEGFYVFDKMYSNYNITFSSIPSMLNLEYFENTHYNTSSTAIEDALLYKIAKYNDYNTFFVKNTYFRLKSSMYLDNVISGKELSGLLNILTMFLNDSIYSSIINNKIVYSFMIKQKRLDERFLLNTKGKKFVFMHMLMPHRPFLYDENGNMSKDYYDIDLGYLPYLKYVNKWTLNKIHQLKNDSNNIPVIIITGDHGMRDNNIFDSQFSTFTAYYNPEQEYSHIKNAKTLLNFFIDFTNYEFETNFPQKKPKIQYLLDSGLITEETISEYMDKTEDVTKQFIK